MFLLDRRNYDLPPGHIDIIVMLRWLRRFHFWEIRQTSAWCRFFVSLLRVVSAKYCSSVSICKHVPVILREDVVPQLWKHRITFKVEMVSRMRFSNGFNIIKEEEDGSDRSNAPTRNNSDPDIANRQIQGDCISIRFMTLSSFLSTLVNGQLSGAPNGSFRWNICSEGL